MPTSPRGREITELEGVPGDIIDRGTAIEQLGKDMLRNATVLEVIRSRSSEQQGKAIESLRDTIGESYDVLREAGELYEPVGPVIRRYGEELESVQPRIDGHAATCRELWETYASLPGSVEPRGTGGLFQPEDDSPEAEQQASEDAAKLAAYDAWADEAARFDTDFDTWEQAFEDAVQDIGDEMADSIEDGFWRSALDWLNGALGWAALVVGVLALIFAGPFVAIALAIGIAVLAITFLQALEGDKEWWEVGLAALAIVPFGKVSTLFSKGGGAFAKEFIKPFTTFGSEMTNIRTLMNAGGGMSAMRALFQNGNPQGAADLISRIAFGKDATGFDRLNDALQASNPQSLALVGASVWDVGHAFVGNVLKYQGWGSKIGGVDSWKTQFPILDVVW